MKKRSCPFFFLFLLCISKVGGGDGGGCFEPLGLNFLNPRLDTSPLSYTLPWKPTHPWSTRKRERKVNSALHLPKKKKKKKKRGCSHRAEQQQGFLFLLKSSNPIKGLP
ncbi:hypothetical protein HMI56_002373 [Coelomomyces lativittatus]|nr:hypothetical protein HMI56_002373 [Coelomomyces lativittatus]